MLNGFLVIKKEPGYTSHQVVAKLRRLLGEDGLATGTLDPMASGVLVTAVGQATGSFLIWMKSERSTGAFGPGRSHRHPGYYRPDYFRSPGDPGLREELAAVFQRKTGRQEQLPPMYSAVKVEGEPLTNRPAAGGNSPGKNGKSISTAWSLPARLHRSTVSPRDRNSWWNAPKGPMSAPSAMISGRNWGAAGAWGNWNAWPPALSP